MRYAPAVIVSVVLLTLFCFQADAGLFKNRRASACAPAATSCAGAAACAGAVQVAPAPAVPVPAAPAACAGAKATGCAGATGCSGTQRAPRQRILFRGKAGC
jgi:hypothetical protein